MLQAEVENFAIAIWCTMALLWKIRVRPHVGIGLSQLSIIHSQEALLNLPVVGHRDSTESNKL